MILGSASPALLKQSGESLAGRIGYLELNGLTAVEVLQHELKNPTDQTEILNRLWLRGGFPDSYLAASNYNSMVWRRDFITTYLQRDIPDPGPNIARETLRRFWTMLAHLSGGLLNRSALARSLDVNATTIARNLDLLVDLLLVRRLPPWHGNLSKRLVKMPISVVEIDFCGQPCDLQTTKMAGGRLHAVLQVFPLGAISIPDFAPAVVPPLLSNESPARWLKPSPVKC